MDFGSSGSGVVRQWRQYNITNYQYSFAGPLSMSKGCDEAFLEAAPEFFIYRGSNPAVVTDATCYMDWIAEQYNLRLDYDYDSKASCSQSSGDKQDINKDECMTTSNYSCDWTRIYDGKVWDSCRLFAEEGRAKNVFQCIDTRVSSQ